MAQRTYLDANAGAPLLDAVRDAVLSALDQSANASSVHAEGRCARELIETARGEVAAAVGAAPSEIVFTSGATEAIALALTPDLRRDGRLAPAGRLYVGATEHPAVLAGGRFSPGAVSHIPVTRSGVVDLEALERLLRAHDHSAGAPYVALMLANNETGVIHPVAEAARLTKAHGGIVFCDAVQGLGRIPVDIAALGVDFLALSAHKIGGPQGAGALVLADGALEPAQLLAGGGQERRRRAGTENMTSIVGFGVAARSARHHLAGMDRIAALRQKVEAGITQVAPDARIFGAEAERLPNTTLFARPGIAAEIAVIAFDLEGIAVSAGAACSSGKVGASHVLAAMGEPDPVARSGIRVSLPSTAEPADAEAFIAAWRSIHQRMGMSRAA